MSPTDHDNLFSPTLTEAGLVTQRSIRDFIITYKVEHDGVSPTMDEIATGTYLSRAGVRYHLRIMLAYGTLKKDGRRGLIVPGGRWIPPESPAQEVTKQRELVQLRAQVKKLERDLEALQDEIDAEVTWWRAKAEQFYHLLKQQTDVAPMMPEYELPASAPTMATCH